MKVIDVIKKIRKRYSEDITINESKMIINKNDNVVLLDVRSSQEFNEGHLINAINIPLYELEARVESRIKDKSTIIIAYCSAGIRSKKAVKILKKLKYSNVFNIKEGV
ncbi:MAG: rhodanese-like domain-containing protein [Clostridiales bacterium]|nr:rhodanese-like domain-containing protein [Clostridiales bacterium]